MILINVFGVGDSCRILYSFVCYLYVSCNVSIASVGEERANFFAIISYHIRYSLHINN